MNISPLTKAAIQHTLHCLAGCAVGEVSGMAIGTALRWHDVPTIVLAIMLAFFFGYMFTFFSVTRSGMQLKEAVKTAVATDTTSITSMEVIDNLIIIVIPGALSAGLADGLFWWSLVAALAIAFVATVPVNRWFIARSGHHKGMHH